MTQYATGTRFEHRTRDVLRANGWIVVRSAGSKTGIDLVAFGGGNTLLMQCKRDGTFPVEEWDALRVAAIAAGPHALPILVRNERGPAFYWLRGPKVRYARWAKQLVQPFDIRLTEKDA